MRRRAVTIWVSVGAAAVIAVGTYLFAARDNRRVAPITKRDDRQTDPVVPQPAPATDAVVPPAKPTSASPEVRALVTGLNRARPGAEADDAVAALTRHGDDAVAEIGRQVAAELLDGGGQHQSVRVLLAINSEPARDTLRRMALGEIGKVGTPVAGEAAQALLKSDPNQARTLLASTSPQVLLPTMNALDGKPLDGGQVKQLRACLANADGPVRWRAAGLLVANTTGALAVDAVAAVGDALTAAAEQPNANAMYSRPGGNTNLEMSALRYINCLKASHVDVRQLSELAGRLKGRARDGVVLAQALRGDQSVRPHVVKLARDAEAGLFRSWAAVALGRIGTAEDLPMLQELAKTDPLRREAQLPATQLPGSWKTVYPVREAARASIARIEKR